jgi:hypothetical protein
MAMVLVMAIVMLCAFFTGVFFFLARGETDRTVVQAREIQATIIGEGVSSRIASLVNQFTWADRFYKQLAPGGTRYQFTHQRFPFDFHEGLFATGDASFVGSVEDLQTPGTYRIKLEILVQGQKVLMTWDKTYPRALLSVASQDSTVLAGHQDPSARDSVDQLLDRIRREARDNRGDGSFRDAGLAEPVDTALTDRRSGRNPGREILWGRER